MLYARKPFKLELKGRSRLVYSENNRTLTIAIEMESGEFDFVVYIGDLQCWDGDGSLNLSHAEKERVKAIIDKELRGNGLKIEWG